MLEPMRNQHFHLSDEQYENNTQKLLSDGLRDGRITEADVVCIRKYIETKETVSKPERRYKITNTLILWKEFLPNCSFVYCTTDDITGSFRKIASAQDENKKPRFRDNTKNDKIKIAKYFVIFLTKEARRAEMRAKSGRSHWLNELVEFLDIDRETIEDFKPPSSQKITKTDADIYSKEEIFSMINACNTTRDRAIISLLYETGCRASEIGNLVWGDVGDKCDFIETYGKTGKRRFIPIVVSKESLLAWKRDYPMDVTNKEAFVFVNYRRSTRNSLDYKPLSYSALDKIVKTIGAMAHIEKPIKLHSFRHTRCSHLIKDNVPINQISMMLWGSVKSNMLDRYAHTNDEDTKRAIAKLYNVSYEEMELTNKEQSSLQPIQCPVCKNVCGPTSDWCPRCGAPLTDIARNSLDGRMKSINDRIKNDPLFAKIIVEKMMEMDTK